MHPTSSSTLRLGALAYAVAAIGVRATCDRPALDALFLPLALFAVVYLTPLEAVVLAAVCLLAVTSLSLRNLTHVGVLDAGLLVTLFTGLILRRRAARYQSDCESVAQLATRVSRSLDTSETLAAIVHAAATLMDAKAASLRLLAPDGETLETAAVHGLSQAYLNKGPVLVRKSPLDRKALQGEAVQIHDVRHDPRFQYPEEAEREGLCSVLCVGLQDPTTAIGVLRVYTGHPSRFGEREVRLLRALASQAALAISHARHHEQTLGYMRKVAHELRAPLGAMSSILKVLLEGLTGNLSEQQVSLLRRADARAEALMALVSDLLSLSRARVSVDQRDTSCVPFGRVVERVIELLGPQAADQGLSLRAEGLREAAEVHADPEQLEQLVANLVSNAIKYTPAGGEVTVRLASEPERLRLTVADTGIGIPAEELPRVWQEFFRGKHARSLGEHSSGLGLSIVKSIAERYGGSASLTSEVNKGTTVEVVLPVAGPATSQPDAA